MIEREHWANAGGEQLVHQAAVEIETLGIWFADSVGLDARPGDGKAVAVQIQRTHQGYIFAIAVVMIASDVAIRSVFDFAWSMREAIPDRFSFAVLIPRAFDLKRRCGRTPVE